MPAAQGPNDHVAQRDWEQYQIQRGVWRYRQSLTREIQRGARAGGVTERSLVDLEPGQRIADEIIKPLCEAIQAAQDQAKEALQDPNLKKAAEDHIILLMLGADVLAVVTVLAALSRTEEAQLQGVALDLGTKVMREVEMRIWRKAEKDAEKQREGADGPREFNMYELMVRNNPTVDTRVFKKWSVRAKNFAACDWTEDTRKRIGTALLGMLIAIDGWFEVRNVRDGMKTKLWFGLTDTARGWISQRHAQNELARPFMLPMLCEPMDYEYLPTKALPSPELELEEGDGFALADD